MQIQMTVSIDPRSIHCTQEFGEIQILTEISDLRAIRIFNANHKPDTENRVNFLIKVS